MRIRAAAALSQNFSGRQTYERVGTKANQEFPGASLRKTMHSIVKWSVSIYKLSQNNRSGGFPGTVPRCAEYQGRCNRCVNDLSRYYGIFEMSSNIFDKGEWKW